MLIAVLCSGSLTYMLCCMYNFFVGKFSFLAGQVNLNGLAFTFGLFSILTDHNIMRTEHRPATTAKQSWPRSCLFLVTFSTLTLEETTFPSCHIRIPSFV